ncbi:oxaloacetate decarboxylase [Marinibaculum pumilum]|uniref:Oxaloacetate decarboxylase n=1 Tax=Marinibaculum pumilum TaxID=1766165 RepID=A0ABV7KUX5_9PROT
MPTQAEKAVAFQALHAGPGAFIIPNPWDIGTTRMLAGLGFRALATTSAGFAFSRGLADGAVGRSAMLDHAAEIVAATDLPVSADLENGYGDSPEAVADCIGMAAAAGLVGCSIEDATGRPDMPLYPPDLAAERIRAAAEAARRLPFPFTLTARAENFLVGRPDLDDAIARLQAYQAAGADVLYAPGLRGREQLAAVVAAVDRPVNALIGLPGITLSELEGLGVRRISTGSAVARAAYGAFLRAAREMADQGSFGFTEAAVPFAEITDLLRR